MKQLVVLALTLVLSQGFAATEDEALALYSNLNQKPATKKSLNEVERERLFRTARFHKVASLEALTKYDPSGLIGFCFGRAMAVHLIARKMGLEESSIKKLFVIGDLRQGSEPEWRFHVTTLVKGETGEWWAVDPIMQPPVSWDGVLKMEDWMKTVQTTWDKKKAAHFYVVDPSTIIPDLRVVPDPASEKGEKVIEVSFDPKKITEGFTEKKVGDFLAYEVSQKAQYKYFTNAFETPADDRFQFLGMTINREHFDYLNYFVDLLEDLSKDRMEPLNTRTMEWSGAAPAGLYSPRVGAWFQ